MVVAKTGSYGFKEYLETLEETIQKLKSTVKRLRALLYLQYPLSPITANILLLEE